MWFCFRSVFSTPFADKIQKDLLDLRFPDVFLTDLCSVIKKRFGLWARGSSFRSFLTFACFLIFFLLLLCSQPKLVQIVSERGSTLPSLTDFAWRTDVIIASDRIARVLQPSMLLSIQTSDGVKRTVSASPEVISDLRFGVARLLSEMGHVESLQILKVNKK